MNVQNGGRQILIQGLFFILAGLVWGLFIPATPFPRLALVAHIGFEVSGILFVILGFVLLKTDHSVGMSSIWVMIVTVWLSWAMNLSAAANAWWGTVEMMPIAAKQAGAIGGEQWQEMVVKATHIFGGISLIVSWALLILGVLRKSKSSGSAE